MQTTAKILKKIYAGYNETFDHLYDLILDKPIEAPGYTRPTYMYRVGIINGKIWKPKDQRIHMKTLKELEEIPTKLNK